MRPTIYASYLPPDTPFLEKQDTSDQYCCCWILPWRRSVTSDIGPFFEPLGYKLRLDTLRLGGYFFSNFNLACIFVNERLPPRSRPWFLPVFNSKRYNALICSLFMISFGLYAPFSDIITHAVDIGLPQSGTMLYIVYIASFCSQVMTGKFADKIARVWVLIIVVAINFNLQFSWWLVTEHNILVFVTIYGLTLGPIISMMVAAMAESAPIPHMTGTYIGTSMGIVGIGDLLGTTVTESMTRLPERSWQIVSGSLMCTGYLLLMFVERRMVTPDE